MPACKHYGICDSQDVDDSGLCILHSKRPNKDKDTFVKTFKAHRKNKGANFRWMVFPDVVNGDFLGAEFTTDAFFDHTTFLEEADFSATTFLKRAVFADATFTKEANFRQITFKEASFYNALFSEEAYFNLASFSESPAFTMVTFTKEVEFSGAQFPQGAWFLRAVFQSAAVFQDTHFEGKVHFCHSRFGGRTLFTPSQEPGAEPIFAGAHVVDFQAVVIDLPETFSFRHADLRRCRFLDTDLRKVELTGVLWPRLGNWFGGRLCVYDELLPHLEPTTAAWWHVAPRERCNTSSTREFCPKSPTGVCKVCEAWEGADRFLWGWLEACGHGCAWVKRFCRERLLRLPPQGSLPWSQIERLYRELKQNHEDRRDYARAGDFHYGEKQMQRMNPQTPWSLCRLLWLYWLASGYGVCWLRPIICALVLWVVSIGAYLWSCGLLPKSAGSQASSMIPVTIGDWPSVALYSLRVMTFLRPDELTPHGWETIAVHTLDSLLGPLFLGLFALAISQRLKR